MSLKAKIEAVIYASEEPVTLAQLLGLLGLEAQGELDGMAGRQGTLYMAGEAGVEGVHPTSENLDMGHPEGRVEGVHSVFENPDMGHPEVVGEGGEFTAEGSQMGTPEGAVGVQPEVGAGEKKVARERERRLREFMRETVDRLVAEYATGDRGIEVREVAGGYRMATKPEYHDAVRGFVRGLKPPLKLTLQALETLAVVAYKQPVTAPEISEIRGVDSGGVLGSLMARKLITTAGRKQVIGRPILYKTTKDFLLRFGLKDVAELPSIEEFEKMAGELAEQDEIEMPPQGSDTKEMAEERITHENLAEEQHATEAQADGDSDDLRADESNRPDDEMPAVDGRLSGLPPTYDKPGDDPSADEAAIQSGE